MSGFRPASNKTISVTWSPRKQNGDRPTKTHRGRQAHKLVSAALSYTERQLRQSVNNGHRRHVGGILVAALYRRILPKCFAQNYTPVEIHVLRITTVSQFSI